MGRPQRPLAGVDAQIFDLLLRVCRIGQHRRAWSEADVHRVAVQHLNARPRPAARPAPPPVGQRPHRPADAYPIPDTRRTVSVSATQGHVLARMVRGQLRDEIAAELGLSRGTVDNAMSMLVRLFGARDRHHVVRLVEAGAVVPRVRGAA